MTVQGYGDIIYLKSVLIVNHLSQYTVYNAISTALYKVHKIHQTHHTQGRQEQVLKDAIAYLWALESRGQELSNDI